LTTLGHDVDVPWRTLPKKTRDWILFTDEQPTVPVYAGYDSTQVRRALKRKEEPSYQGTFTSARRHVLQSYATSTSERMRRRAEAFVVSAPCPECGGKRLNAAALSVHFAGLDIAALSALPLKQLAALVAQQAVELSEQKLPAHTASVRRRICDDLQARLAVLLDLGLGYLSVDRSTPTLSPGELQRLRLATQVRSNLFGVVYVLDEPSAGLHPADTEALLRALDGLKAAGNSLFVVEHEIDVIRRADWIVDVGPQAGDAGGQILYSGPLQGLAAVTASSTRRYVFERDGRPTRAPRKPEGWLQLQGIRRNNLRGLEAEFPLGVLTCVTGVSGSGKSTLVSQVLVSLIQTQLGVRPDASDEESSTPAASACADATARDANSAAAGQLGAGADCVKRLVVVDQKPIGRTPRSNLATYTGLFDAVRKLFASTKAARARGYDAGRFSFNVPGGRCATCNGEGFVMVELLFLPSVYAPCSVCGGARYNPKTLEIELRGQSIAGVLSMSVDAAREFFQSEPNIARALDILHEVGLGYLRLGQPATELSGGEAQRIKLATELQRSQRAGTLYVLDEPTTGLHPADVERLLQQLQSLVDSGASVIVVEHDMALIAESDWIVDMGPGAGDEGGEIVFAGTPTALLGARDSRTAPYLRKVLQR
jgi:excinuclease ABC subunit A